MTDGTIDQTARPGYEIAVDPVGDFGGTASGRKIVQGLDTAIAGTEPETSRSPEAEGVARRSVTHPLEEKSQT